MEFLKSLGENAISVADIVKEYQLWRGGCYEKLTKINAHATRTAISKDGILQIYKMLYDCWYDYLLSRWPNGFSALQQQKLKKFFSIEKYRKENMTPQDCADFVHYGYDTILKNTGLRLMHSQQGNDPVIDDSGVYPDFMHCCPFEAAGSLDCRLYLNVKPHNIAPLCEALLKKCFAKRQRIYFKFWTNDNRNDTFLIYCGYSTVQKKIELLREIRKEQPELFEGCENINPLLVNIDGFIGFGEEPKYEHSSYNSERADAIGEFVADVVTPKVVEERKKIGNYTGKIQTSKGESLLLEDYLVYRIETSFRETVEKNLEAIEKGMLPRKFTAAGRDAIESYIALQKKLYSYCLAGMPAVIKQQIRDIAKNYLEGLKNGYNTSISSLKIPTNDFNLFPTSKRADLERLIKENGSIDYFFPIEIDLQNKLFDVFGSTARIESLITDEALAPYLEKHHVSSKHPMINTETEEMIENQDA